MSVKIVSNLCESVFSYSGEDSELWLKAVERTCKLYALVDNGKTIKARVDVNNTTYFLKSLKAIRDCISRPEYFVIVERMLQQIESGKWELEREFSYGVWKVGVRQVWKQAKVARLLELESKVYDALTWESNCGVSVGYILEWLLERGFYARYVDVKQALSHLLRLCVVEYHGDMWSTRYGVLEVV